MKSTLMIIFFSVFVFNAKASVAIGNPCNVGDCTNLEAEKIIDSIYAYADQIRSLSQYIDDNGVDKLEALKIANRAKDLRTEAYEIYRNFGALLNINDNSKRASVNKGYSSHSWRSYLSVQNELYRLNNKVKYMKIANK